jgi:hypothetical protein
MKSEKGIPEDGGSSVYPAMSGEFRRQLDSIDAQLKFENRYKVRIPAGATIKCGMGHDVRASEATAYLAKAEEANDSKMRLSCHCRVEVAEIRRRVLAVAERD